MLALMVGLGALPSGATSIDAAVTTVRGSALPLRGELESAAASSAASQAASGDLAHSNINPLTNICSAVAEVVGAGSTIDAIFAAFRESPLHMSKLTNPSWTAMGTAVAKDNSGTVFVSVILCTENGPQTAPPPSAPSTTVPRSNLTASARLTMRIVRPPVLQLQIAEGRAWSTRGTFYPI